MLNFAELHHKTANLSPGLINILAGLFLFSFSVKSALFPLYAWLPASYHTLPSSVAALFAALLTKVGIYAVIRMFTLVFPFEFTYFANVLPDFLRFLVQWISNDIARVLMGLGFIVHLVLAVYVSILYVFVRKTRRRKNF